MTRWLFIIALWGWLAACSGETEGRIIEVRWVLSAAESGDREFVTDTGWQVQLDEAKLGVESVLALAPERDSLGAIAQLSRLLVPVARAHGGHDEATGRRIRAEWLDPLLVDVLAAEPSEPTAALAEEGAVDMFKLNLAREATGLPDELDGAHAYVRGSAERDGRRIAFVGSLRFADPEPGRRIDSRTPIELQDGGTIVLDVDAAEWFRSAEFDRLPAAGEGAREITPETQVGRAWAIGVRSPAAIDFSWNDGKD